MDAPVTDGPPLGQRIGDTIKRVGRRLRATAAGRTMAISIDRTTAEFRVETSVEYDRYANLTDVFRTHVRQLLECLEPGDVVWDVGACTGRYACLAARSGADVVAVEPNPYQHARLAENLERNGAEPVVYPYALGDSPGQMPIQGMAVVGAAAQLGRDPESVHVAVRTGDELVSEGIAPAPDVIKLDVDGAEVASLDGLTESLDGCHDVFVEVHEGHGVDWDDVVDRLRAAGFEVETVGERTVGGTTKVRGARPD